MYSRYSAEILSEVLEVLLQGIDLYCLCAGVTLNLREVRFATRIELKSIECLIGNVVPRLLLFKSPKNGNSKLTNIVSLLVRPFFFKLLF